MTDVPPSDKRALPAPQARPEVPVVELRQLIGDGRELVLMHLGEAYRLRITARDRLILTK